MASDTITEADFPELDCRANDGLELALLLSDDENRHAVTVSDSRSGERFVVESRAWHAAWQPGWSAVTQHSTDRAR
jgi:hypothetical protein